MPNTKTNRKPKFRRVPPEKPLLLTERDLAIFDALERYRYLTSDLICRLIEGSADKIRRRLQLLFHDSYIDRPEVQIKLYQPTTNDPFIYALGVKGAQAMRNYGSPRAGIRGLTNRNKTSGRPYIQHSLAIAEVMTAFEHAAGEDFIPQARFSTHSETSRAPHWRVMLDTPDQPEMLGVVPDHAFGLRGMEGKMNYFFLEADNGTMPVTRIGPRQTSLLQKVRAYLVSNEAQIPQQNYQITAPWSVFARLSYLNRDKNLYDPVSNYYVSAKRKLTSELGTAYALGQNVSLNASLGLFHLKQASTPYAEAVKSRGVVGSFGVRAGF